MFPGADAWEKSWVLFVVVILAHIVKSFEVYEGTPILRKTKAEAPIKEVWQTGFFETRRSTWGVRGTK